MTNQRGDLPWSPAEDAALLAFVSKFRSWFDCPASVVARKMSAKFPQRRFTRDSVSGRLRRIRRWNRKQKEPTQ